MKKPLERIPSNDSRRKAVKSLNLKVATVAKVRGGVDYGLLRAVDAAEDKQI